MPEKAFSHLEIKAVTEIFRAVQKVCIPWIAQAAIDVKAPVTLRAHRIVDQVLSRFLRNHVGADGLIAEIRSTAGHLKRALGQAHLTAQGTFIAKDDGHAET